MYINIFTKENFQEAGIEVVNISFDTLQKPILYSTGIHPWYVDYSNIEKALEKFHILSSEKNCIAIGECGLDKTFESNNAEQKKVFEVQLKTANLLKKPIILYCFKAWDEVMATLQKLKNKTPLIIPIDYLPENKDTLNELKDFYVAFDKDIYLKNPKAIYWIKNISSKKILFFNNDESISIKDIYQSASEVLNIDLHTLQLQVLENFYKAFMLEKLPL
jgi:TatD DNase family protein